MANIIASGTWWRFEDDGTLYIYCTGDMPSREWDDYTDDITAVDIADSVTSIVGEAFSYCENLSSVTIPSSVTSIGDFAFDNCGLTSVAIPYGVISIGDDAFNMCASLASVTIPDSVTSIGHDAFYYCTSLTSVTIGSSVTSIGYFAFCGCSGLTSVTIPVSVTSIGYSAFLYCDALEDVYYAGTVAQWDAIDIAGYEYDDPLRNGAAMIHYNGSLLPTYIVTFESNNGDDATHTQPFPAETAQALMANPYTYYRHTFIGWNTEYDGSGTNYADGATYTATSNVTLYAQWISALSSITITTPPTKTTYTEKEIFEPYGMEVTAAYGDDGTENVSYDCKFSPSVALTVADTAITVSYTYDDITVTTTVAITVTESEPMPGVTAFCDWCTLYDTGLLDVYCVGDMPRYYDWYPWESYAESITSVILHDGVTSIESSVFDGCTSLTSVTIPGSVTSIGSSAFSNCTSLTSVTIPIGVTSIELRTFRDCTALTSVTIPDSVTSIEYHAFDGCSSLTDVYYSGTESQWNAINIRYGNSKLTNATIHLGYAVTFDANGGTGNMSAQTFTAGTAQTLTANTFTRSGYTFGGWNTAADGSGTNYADGASYTATEDVTLYAQWTQVTLSSIAVTTPPTTTAYTVGDTFDSSGMTVTATYSDNTTAAVSGYSVSPSGALTVNDSTVTISYTEGGTTKTATVAITVTEATPEPTPTANRITIQIAKRNGGTLTFSEHAVKQLEYVQSTSFDGNDMQADEFSAVIRQTAPDWLNNWNGVNRACAVILTLVSRTEKYYFKSIRRIGKHDFELTAQSPLGRLTDDFTGGLYSAALLSDVIRAVIGNSIPVSAYSVNPLLEKVRVYGWIPYQERRTTLHQLALAYGFIIRRDTNNNLYFTVPDTDNAYTIPDNAIFTGGSIDYSVGRKYACADITAYDYLQRETEAQVLFDNTGGAPADKLIVRFDSPMFDLQTDNLRVSAYGVNYAEVSGYGQLTGKSYMQISSVISVRGDSEADPQQVLSVSNVPMITSLNAASVGERLLNYHNAPTVVNMDILRTSQRSGDYVSFTDPFGDPQTGGYITALSGSITSLDRASASVVCGYVPIWGAAYDTVVVLTGSGSWTVPSHLNGKTIRIVLIGGGTGGAGGQHGTDANGKGGVGGSPGAGGNILDTTLTVSGENSFQYQCGTGGAGGVASDVTVTVNSLDDSTRVYESNNAYHLEAHGEGTFYATTLKAARDKGLTPCPDCFKPGDRYYVNNAGSEGTASTFGSETLDVNLTSFKGSPSDIGFYDILETKMYAAPGAYNGVDGGDATTGIERTQEEDKARVQQRIVPEWLTVVQSPVSLPWDTSQEWKSGEAGAGDGRHEEAGNGHIYDWAYGGLGGGAAVGCNGNDGESAPDDYIGGRGGNGANADTIFPVIRYGGGGNGGHGGGEGGAGGKGYSVATGENDPETPSNGASGSGGNGSNGQNGADGCILIYYKSPDNNQ